MAESEKEKTTLATKLSKEEEAKTSYRNEVQIADAEVEKLQSELAKTIEKGKFNAKRVVQLEIENEEL